MEDTQGKATKPVTRGSRSNSSASSQSGSRASSPSNSTPSSPRPNPGPPSKRPRVKSSERPPGSSPSSSATSTPETPAKQAKRASDKGQGTPPKEQGVSVVQVDRSELEALLNDEEPLKRVHGMSAEKRDEDVKTLIEALEKKLTNEKDKDVASKVQAAIGRLIRNDRTRYPTAANYFKQNPGNKEDAMAELDFIRDVILSAVDYLQPATRSQKGDIYHIGARPITGLISRVHLLRREINEIDAAAAKKKERAEQLARQKEEREREAEQQQARVDEARKKVEASNQALRKSQAVEDERKQAAVRAAKEAETKKQEAERLITQGTDEAMLRAAEAARAKADIVAKEAREAAEKASKEKKANEDLMAQETAALKKILAEQQANAIRKAEDAELAYRSWFRTMVNDVVQFAIFYVEGSDGRRMPSEPLDFFSRKLEDETPPEQAQRDRQNLMVLIKGIHGINETYIQKRIVLEEDYRKRAVTGQEANDTLSKLTLDFRWALFEVVADFLLREETAMRRASGRIFEDMKSELGLVDSLLRNTRGPFQRRPTPEELARGAQALRAIAEDHLKIQRDAESAKQRADAEAAELAYRTWFRNVVKNVVVLATFFVEDFGGRRAKFEELRKLAIKIVNDTPLERKESPSHKALLALITTLSGINDERSKEEENLAKTRATLPPQAGTQVSLISEKFKWDTFKAIAHFLRKEEEAMLLADKTIFGNGNTRKKHEAVFNRSDAVGDPYPIDVTDDALGEMARDLRTIAGDHVHATVGQRDKRRQTDTDIKNPEDSAELPYRAQFQIAVANFVQLATSIILDFGVRKKATDELRPFINKLDKETPPELKKSPAYEALVELVGGLLLDSDARNKREQDWDDAIRSKGANPVDISTIALGDELEFKWSTFKEVAQFLRAEDNDLERNEGIAFETIHGKRKREHQLVFDLLADSEEEPPAELSHDTIKAWALALQVLANDHVTAVKYKLSMIQQKITARRVASRERAQLHAMGPRHLQLMGMATRYLQPLAPRDRPNLVPCNVAIMGLPRGGGKHVTLMIWSTLAHKFISVFARGESQERNFGYAIYLDGSVAVPVRPTRGRTEADSIVEGSLAIAVLLLRDKIGMVFDEHSGIWARPDDADVSLYRHGEVRSPVDVPEGRPPRYKVDEMLLQLARAPNAKGVPAIRRIMVHRWSVAVTGADRIPPQAIKGLFKEDEEEEEAVDDTDLPELRDGPDDAMNPNVPD